MPEATGAAPRFVIATAAVGDLIAAGYNVTTVGKRADVLRFVEALGPDVSLIALELPGLYGSENCFGHPFVGAESMLVADVELDGRRRVVTRAGQPVELTLTEYSLLELLMRNANVVLERATIYERLWGADLHLSSEALDVHVGALRKKLERHGGRIVHNVRGVGYVVWTDPS